MPRQQHHRASTRLSTITLMLSLIACGLVSPAYSADTPISHIVLVWLKPEISPEQAADILAATKQLEAIPGVINVRAGNPLPSERSIVDDSFSFGISISFTSPEALRAYQNHPIHVDHLNQHIRGKASKLLIYDF